MKLWFWYCVVMLLVCVGAMYETMSAPGVQWCVSWIIGFAISMSVFEIRSTWKYVFHS